MLDDKDAPLEATIREPVESIAVDREYVYWTCKANDACYSIRKVSTRTGVTSQVAEGNSSCGLAVDEQSVYWCEGEALFRADK